MNDKLAVLFLWHMHQPSYQVDDDGYLLPWTRLHALKDYLGFARIIGAINTPVTFNFTPVLWEQLEGYAAGKEDQELEISRKSVESLSMEEKRFLLEKLFLCNKETMIKPIPRYSELLDKFGNISDAEVKIRRATIPELRDLIAWRTLAWIDPDTAHSDAFLSAMIEKGRNFSEDEKNTIIQRSIELIRSIPDRYRRLHHEKIIELTTTPYYHPILPLLIDPDSARDAIPRIKLPPPFSFKEDAAWHVRAAILKHESLFGVKPSGMWPAEGSVSPDAVAMFAHHGLRWIATDEDILARSAGVKFFRDNLGQVNLPDILYRPWRIDSEEGPITIFFRDHLLSDLIGFEYQRWDSEKAISDFESRLISILERLRDKPFKPAVSIILDGENAWEHYPQGIAFIEKLLKRLAENPRIQLQTFTNYLNTLLGTIAPLPRLASGSWINGNFGIWIGNPEENLAWDLLRQANDSLNSRKRNISKEVYDICKHYIHRAQASDWFWWYGDDHYTEEKFEFDNLFRKNLINVFTRLNIPVPSILYKGIATGKSRQFKLIHPKTLLSPSIDGKKGGYFDWFGAGTIHYRGGYSSMHASGERLFQSVRFGFDLEKLYIRLDPVKNIRDYLRETIRLNIYFPEPSPEIVISLILKDTETSDSREIPVEISIYPQTTPVVRGVHAAFVDVLEVSISFALLKVQRNDAVEFFIEILKGNRHVGRIPDNYGIQFNVPTEDYDSLMWEV